jgi:hypothetical protein
VADRPAALVRHPEAELEERPALDLKGKHEAVPVYAPKVPAAEARAPRG